MKWKEATYKKCIENKIATKKEKKKKKLEGIKGIRKGRERTMEYKWSWRRERMQLTRYIYNTKSQQRINKKLEEIKKNQEKTGEKKRERKKKEWK